MLVWHSMVHVYQVKPTNHTGTFGTMLYGTYRHSGATGKPVGAVSIEDITVYYGSNSTAMSAAYRGTKWDYVHAIAWYDTCMYYHGSSSVPYRYVDNAHAQAGTGNTCRLCRCRYHLPLAS